MYSRGHSPAKLTPGGPRPKPEDARPGAFLANPPAERVQPGECYPWRQKRAEIPTIEGDEQLFRTIWQNMEGLSNTFIWQLLLSF